MRDENLILHTCMQRLCLCICYFKSIFVNKIMGEVTKDNFTHLLEDIKTSFKKAKFIAIDTEFSALKTIENTSNSLFDTPKERYAKLRALCQQIIPLQIGISAFVFNPEENSYQANMYTFYVVPQKFHNINPAFVFQSSTLQFLGSYNFDFNKFVYHGLPYINRSQEMEIKNLQKQLSDNGGEFNDNVFEHIIDEVGTKISKWLINSKATTSESNILILPGIIEKYNNCCDILYYLHKYIRKRFNKRVWTTEDKGDLVVRKVASEEYNKLDKEYNLDEIMLNKILGFTHVFRLLVEQKKPIIGHNLLTDLMIMYQRFENPLPKSYQKFKQEMNNLFPVIYDTKCITFELKRSVPENKMWEHNMLEVLYKYFKDGYGRHLALNSPLIELQDQVNYDQFHNAGWDSYCTGYIFIRMAHIYAKSKFPSKKKFMNSELFASISHFKNCVNLIRCSVTHIKLDEGDPHSQRPPCLIIESKKDVPLDLLKISYLLSSYGFVEIKPHSRGGRRAIVAVDNFGSARRILRQYKTHDEFQIKQYSILKHSPIARAAVWSGILASGVLLAWLGHSIIRS